jgi:hypothetical protein
MRAAFHPSDTLAALIGRYKPKLIRVKHAVRVSFMTLLRQVVAVATRTLESARSDRRPVTGNQ